jgi:hypothetical protein
LHNWANPLLVSHQNTAEMADLLVGGKTFLHVSYSLLMVLIKDTVRDTILRINLKHGEMI